tara:strand:- start:17 stop:358 length:342 start_codon:yes stop_codon:yes gene_type:complete
MVDWVEVVLTTQVVVEVVQELLEQMQYLMVQLEMVGQVCVQVLMDLQNRMLVVEVVEVQDHLQEDQAVVLVQDLVEDLEVLSLELMHQMQIEDLVAAEVVQVVLLVEVMEQLE